MHLNYFNFIIRVQQDLDYSLKFDAEIFGYNMQSENLKKMENEVKTSKSEIGRLTRQLHDLNDHLLTKSQNEAQLNSQSTNLNKLIENSNRQLDDLKTEFDQINKLNDQLTESNNC